MKKTLISLLLGASMLFASGCISKEGNEKSNNTKSTPTTEQSQDAIDESEQTYPEKATDYNLVFIPVNIQDSDYFNRIVDEYLDTEEPVNTFETMKECGIEFNKLERGLFTQEPYKSNKELFTVEVLPNIDYVLNSFEEYLKDNYLISKFKFRENDVPIFVINTGGLEGGVAGNCSSKNKYIKLFLTLSEEEIEKRLNCGIMLNDYALTHELSHYFGLTDERLLEGEQKNEVFPNCTTREDAEKSWGNLVGNGEGVLRVGYFQGCDKYPDYVRPTEWSLMGSNLPGRIYDHPEVLGDRILGEFNIRYIEGKLN